MARNVQAQLEREADHKHLTGERRQEYIGGAWNRIKGGDPEPEEGRAALNALGLDVAELRHSTPRPRGHKRIHLRSGETWYELTPDEYRRLVREGKAAARDAAREQKRAERAAAASERDAARQEKIARMIERAEHGEVLSLIRSLGGIKRGRRHSEGGEIERSEYNTLPSHVRAKAKGGGGFYADEVAAQLLENMPWLHIETSRDLYDYFERHEDRRIGLHFRRRNRRKGAAA